MRVPMTTVLEELRKREDFYTSRLELIRLLQRLAQSQDLVNFATLRRMSLSDELNDELKKL